METGTELAVPENMQTLLAKANVNLDDQVEGASATDLIVPRALLMQAMHPLVNKERKRNLGEIASSDGGELVDTDNPTGPLKVIPFGLKKGWRIEKLDSNGKTCGLYRREPVTPDNITLDWGPFSETGEDGKEIELKRLQSWELYCVQAKEATHGPGFPLVVEFKSTSFRVGKSIYSKIKKLQEFKAPVFVNTCVLSAKQEDGDKGSYLVWDLAWDKSTEQEFTAGLHWFELMRSKTIKVQEEDQVIVDVSPTDDEVPF